MYHFYCGNEHYASACIWRVKGDKGILLRDIFFNFARSHTINTKELLLVVRLLTYFYA